MECQASLLIRFHNLDVTCRDYWSLSNRRPCGEMRGFQLHFYLKSGEPLVVLPTISINLPYQHEACHDGAVPNIESFS